MSNALFSNARGRLAGSVAVLLRVDRWPKQLRQRAGRASEVLAFALRRAREVQLARVAGSLTFTTTLSIVPLLAVALSVFAAFPMFGEFRLSLEKFLLREMLPPQVSATILRYLHDFTANAAGVTAFGLLFLVVTALLMIHTVDRVLNDIWNARGRRNLMARILIYWALLTLGPLAIGASLSATSYLLSLYGGPLARPSAVTRFLLDVAPFVLGGLALAALYVMVPNRRVAWRDALIGGFVASALGEMLGQFFGLYIRTGNLTSIYGAFSAVPLFLLGVYLSWYALLFGAAIAATLPMLRATRFADERRAGNRFLTAVLLLRLLLQAREQGSDGGRMTVAELARGLRCAEDTVEHLLADLEKLGYISRLDGMHAGKWLLTCDIDRITLLPVFARLAIDPANTLIAGQPLLRIWLEDGLQGRWLQQPIAAVLGESASCKQWR
jgi:membrane protein